MSQESENPEIDILIEPKPDVLESKGITEEVFGEALDALFEKANEEEPSEDAEQALEDWPIVIQGNSYRLGDLAEVQILELPEGFEDEEDFEAES